MVLEKKLFQLFLNVTQENAIFTAHLRNKRFKKNILKFLVVVAAHILFIMFFFFNFKSTAVKINYY